MGVKKDYLRMNKNNKVLDYKNFLFESDDKPKFKVVPMFISDQLSHILKGTNTIISKTILNDPENHDISFLDCEIDKDKIDKISFLPASKSVVGMLSDSHIDIKQSWEAKGRQEITVGRLVNKLFPNKFNQKEIDEFVNNFKTEISKYFTKFRLVEGEDIRKYYLLDNYESNRGDINQSCMRGKDAQKYLDIYVKNPEKCKLLVLMSDKDIKKIKGRALVWFDLRKPLGKIYMDRVYTINQADVKLYIDYAKEHNWLYKSDQVMHDVSYFDNDKKINSSVTIQLKPIKFDTYPSLDTLQYYTPSTGRLSSSAGNFILGNPRYHLTSTTGDARKLDK